MYGCHRGQRVRRTSLSFFILGRAAKWAAGLAALCALWCDSPPARGAEGRALWVVRDALVSEQSIAEMVHTVAQSGFDRIFVQVCGRGDAYYQSSRLPRARSLSAQPEAFDPLQRVIEHAHGQSLQVHAWINVLYVWSEVRLPPDTGHVANLHPEWIDHTVTDRSLLSYERPNPFGTEGLFLSPALPAVRAWVADIVQELVAYDIDGIHLDYIRYGGAGTGFHPEARARFKESYGFDPLDLYGQGGFRISRGGQADSLARLWMDWRSDQVTQVVRDFRRCVQAEDPDIRLSAAVKPECRRAAEEYGQDWKRWIDEGLVDFVALMAYSSKSDVVARQLTEARQQVGSGGLFAGLAMYTQPADSMVRKIDLVRQIGVDGIALFSYNSVVADPAYLDVIRRDCFQTGAAAPAIIGE